jgi:hypothetical protein
MVDLQKRHILKLILGSGAVAAGCYGLLSKRQTRNPGIQSPSNRPTRGSEDGSGLSNRKIVEPLLPDQTEFLRSFGFSQQQVDQMLLNARKMQTPDRISPDDVFLTANQRAVIPATIARLGRIQRHFGHGYFNILGFNQLLKSAAATIGIGRFTVEEMGLLQWLFYQDAATYGFMGERVVNDLLADMRPSLLHYDTQSGQYLYKRRSKPLFDRMRADIGSDLILTSGVRVIPKQSALFLAKLIACDGNVSMASRSLAPPGYSFHFSGDFDVGSAQLAGENFSRAFSRSEVYRMMQRLPYVTLRYPDQNQAGVRFEPWHVKVNE